MKFQLNKTTLAIIGGVALAITIVLCIIAALGRETNNKPVVKPGTESEMSEVTQTPGKTEDTEESESSEWMSELETEVGSETGTEGSTGTGIEVPDLEVDAPYYIRVNRQANCVTVYTKDANGKYTVPVKAMICSVGLSDETPLGTTVIYQRYVWRALFGGTYGHYTVRFNGHILFHSVPYLQTKNDTLKPGQYNMLGEPASQGCIRLTVEDAKWIYDNCINGTKVEVYDSPDPGPLGKPTAYKIDEKSPYAGWDPTDPNANNPWKKGEVKIEGAKDITVKVGDKVDLLAGVTAKDIDGLPLEVKVTEGLDFSKAGEYKVTYTATGVLNTTATVEVKVTVKEAGTGDSEQPGTEQPGGSEQPGTEQPGGSENAGSEQPGGSEGAGSEQPGSETPGSEQPGSETPGSEQPGSETPGSGDTSNGGDASNNTQTPGGSESTEDPGSTQSDEEEQGLELGDAA